MSSEIKAAIEIMREMADKADSGHFAWRPEYAPGYTLRKAADRIERLAVAGLLAGDRKDRG